MSQLHEKMLKEVEQSEGNTITERLHVWMCNCDDSKLLEAMSKEGKTLNKATEYLYAKGSKIAVNGVADVTPEMEIDWFKEYLLKEKIEEAEFKKMRPNNGASNGETKVVEKIVEVVNPTFDQIANYIKQTKKQKANEKKEKDPEDSLQDEYGTLSLFEDEATE